MEKMDHQREKWNAAYRNLEDSKPNGTFLFRVNSVRDTHYGAGMGDVIERNYYEIDQKYHKRFFDRDDLHLLVADWHIDYLQEHELDRYGKTKILWEVAVSNRDNSL